MIGGESAVWRGLRRGQLRDPRRDRIVEPQASFVAQQEDGGRREALGHRGDPEAAVPVGWRVGPGAERAVARRVRQTAVDDDPVGEARDEIARGEPLEDGVHLGQGVAQGHVTRVPSRPAPRKTRRNLDH